MAQVCKPIGKEHLKRMIQGLKNDIKRFESRCDALTEAVEALGDNRQQTLPTRSNVVNNDRFDRLGKFLQERYRTQRDFDKHRNSHLTDSAFCSFIYDQTGFPIRKGELKELRDKYLMPDVEVVGGV